MLLTVNKVNEVVSGIIGTKKYAVPFSKDVYDALVSLETQFDTVDTVENAKLLITAAEQAISGATLKKDIALFGDSLKYDEASQKYFLYSNGVTSRHALPKSLATKIVEAVEKELSPAPLIKAWTWFLKNPKFTAKKAEYFAKYITTTTVDKEIYAKYIEEGYTHEKATELATFNDVSITKNGLLSTYKYAQIKYKMKDTKTGDTIDRYDVTYDAETGKPTVNLPSTAEEYYLIPPVMGEGGDAYFTGDVLGHKISVGQVHYLAEWSQVDCTDGRACLPGLHLGGLRYIAGYGGGNSLLLNCFVNPMHIGAFTDTGDGAIRVKEYFVQSAQFAPNRAMYHESDYLARTTAQWTELRSEAIAATNKKIAELQKLTEEVNAI